MDEKKLIQAAENGDIQAAKTLAKYYDEKSTGGHQDKVGDVMTMEDFMKMLDAADDEPSNEDFKIKAYKYYRIADEGGDVESMTQVAIRLYDEIGVAKNEEESDHWYRLAAENGDPSAMRVVAFRSKDDAEKFKYYKLSAELDEPGLNKQDSIKETAINYACGRGTEKDIEQAKIWLEKLDQQTAASARMEISEITGDNSWLEQAAEYSANAMIKIAEQCVSKNDFVTALSWYKKAASKGSEDAMSIVGDILYIGEDGISQDYAQAFAYYSQAAELGSNMADIKRTLMIYKGLEVEKDLSQAFENFSRIALTREPFFGPLRFNSVARYYAAKMQENGEGCEKNSDETLEAYKFAGGLKKIHRNESARRIPKAIYKVADYYFMNEQFSKAAKFYEQVISIGDGRTPYHREAIKKLMWIYELGEGVPQDKEKAESWRKKLENPSK